MGIEDLYKKNSQSIDQAKKTLMLLDKRSQEPLDSKTLESLKVAQATVKQLLKEAEEDLDILLQRIPNSFIDEAIN